MKSRLLSGTTAGYEEFRKEWRTLGSVTIAASFGFPTLAFFSIGIFAPIFADEFGWSFGVMMSGILIASLSILFLGPFVGRYIDAKGARKITAISLAGFGLGYMSLALSNGSIALYFASWAMMSIAGVGATAISFTYIVNNAFHERRGLALGVALSSSGISAMIVKPLAGLTIALFGWRETIILIGLMPIVISAPILFLGVRNEARRRIAREGRQSIDVRSDGGHSIGDALRTRHLWILLIAFTAIAFGNGAPIPNLENILKTHRFETGEIIAITSTIGAALIVGRILGGWLIDKFWAPMIGFILLVCAAMGCWILALGGASVFQAQVAVILISIAAGVEYDLLSFLVAKYLGRRHYGAIYSLIFGFFAISTGIGPMLLGRLYDIQNDYMFGLALCSAMLLFAAGMLLALGRYPDATKTDSGDAMATTAHSSEAD